MKHVFSKTTARIAGIIVCIVFGATIVSAWTAPTAPAPGGNVPAPINTGEFNQIKDGGIFSKKFFVAPRGFFTKVFAPGTTSRIRVGSGSDTDLGLEMADLDTSSIPVGIDLAGRGNANAVEFFSDKTAQCADQRKVTLIADSAPAFHFFSRKANTNADIIARQVQLTGGSPAAGKILTSTDASGNAAWGTVNSQVFVPDIRMVERRVVTSSDAESVSVSCPANYAAIAIACDADHDAGYDTCKLTPDLTPSANLMNPWAGEAAKGKYSGGTASAVANNGAALQIWLTCMRYTGYDTVADNFITVGSSPVAAAQQCTADPDPGLTWATGICGKNGTTSTGKARVINLSANGGVYDDNACLVDSVERGCYTVPYGSRTDPDGGTRATTSCTRNGQSLQQKI